MKRPQLTEVQKKFLLIKILHLLAVVVIVAVLSIYFHKDITPKSENKVSKETGINTDISAYEQFCRNNRDMSCGGIEYFDEITDTPQVVLMDTGEVDDKLKAQISQVVAGGCEVKVEPEDMNKLLDKLYEEELPDDIIDENIEIKNTKMKGMHIIPTHKPPYFGAKPVIVVVIDDMGVSPQRTADIASLQAPLTVSFLTYAKHLNEQIDKSRSNGQEIMIHVPMEALSKVDEAPDVLTTKMKNEEIRNNLQAMLSKFKDVKGINNHMGSKLTEDKSRMMVVMKVLKEHGMFFLDSKTSPKSKAENAAAEIGIAYAHRHIFLDNNNDKAYILGQLKKAETLAHKNGYAIAIGHPKTQTYAALKEWLPKLEQKGLEIIPLSSVIKVLNPQNADIFNK